MNHGKAFNIEEIKEIDTDKITAFYELANPQPKGFNFIEMQGLSKTAMLAYFHNPSTNGNWHIDVPYGISKIHINEKWFWWIDHCEYEDTMSTEGSNIEFNSADIMPEQYARTWIEIESVRCMRLQEIDAYEMELMGLLPIQGELEKHHSKLNSTESYDSNPFIFFYTFSKI